MTGKTTEEHVLSLEIDLQREVERQAMKAVLTKEVRLKAAQTRAVARQEENEATLAVTSPGDDMKPMLQRLKRERRATERESRKRTPVTKKRRTKSSSTELCKEP